MPETRHAIVTGAGSGIGAACAAALAAAHDTVSLFIHNHDEEARAAAAATKGGGATPTLIVCDVSDEASVEAAFAEAVGTNGPPSTLVNSAGVNMSGVPVRDMTLDHWRKAIGVDLTGAFLVTRAMLRACPDGASLIHISSIHAEVVRAGGADYAAAKAGLDKMVQTVAVEEGPRGNRINAILPGMILTPMNERAMADEDYRASLTRNIPMKRAGKPEEVADLAVFLASDRARYITGATIVIDGALSLLLGQGA